MKVMCIKNGVWSTQMGDKINFPTPSFGEIVTVIGQSITGEYLLKEYKSDFEPECGWCKNRFVPLSTIDETELLEQRQYQLQEL